MAGLEAIIRNLLPPKPGQSDPLIQQAGTIKAQDGFPPVALYPFRRLAFSGYLRFVLPRTLRKQWGKEEENPTPRRYR